MYFLLYKVKIDDKTNTSTELTTKIDYSLCQEYISCCVLFTLSLDMILNFFHKLSLSSYFVYSATVKPRQSADYIGMKISVLSPTQLELTVIGLTILHRILQIPA